MFDRQTIMTLEVAMETFTFVLTAEAEVIPASDIELAEEAEE